MESTTGTQLEIPQTINDLARLARRHDLAAMHRLVDFHVMETARMVRALAELDPEDREELCRLGLADIERSQASWTSAASTLEALSLGLVGANDIRPATPSEAREYLSQLRIASLPAGLSEASKAAITRLAEPGSRMRQVFLFEGSERPVALALAPDGEKVVWIRRITGGSG